eukprot:jgi/Hompol1/4166/HPOL_006959-RA
MINILQQCFLLFFVAKCLKWTNDDHGAIHATAQAQPPAAQRESAIPSEADTQPQSAPNITTASATTTGSNRSWMSFTRSRVQLKLIGQILLSICILLLSIVIGFIKVNHAKELMFQLANSLSLVFECCTFQSILMVRWKLLESRSAKLAGGGNAKDADEDEQGNGIFVHRNGWGNNNRKLGRDSMKNTVEMLHIPTQLQRATDQTPVDVSPVSNRLHDESYRGFAQPEDSILEVQPTPLRNPARAVRASDYKKTTNKEIAVMIDVSVDKPKSPAGVFSMADFDD